MNVGKGAGRPAGEQAEPPGAGVALAAERRRNLAHWSRPGCRLGKGLSKSSEDIGHQFAHVRQRFALGGFDGLRFRHLLRGGGQIQQRGSDIVVDLPAQVLQLLLALF